MTEKFSMFDFIDEVCDEIGPRLGTSEQELKAGMKIKGILEKSADEVFMEEFLCHPEAFLDFIRIAFIVDLIATILFIWFPLISFFLYLYGLSIFVFESMVLKEYIDFFFPKNTGSNVIGKLKPLKEPKQIVVCSAHHDSAYQFPLFEKFKLNSRYLAFFTAGLVVLSAILSLVKFFLDIFGLLSIITTIILLIVPILSVVMVGYMTINLHSKYVILGANDNLSGVAVVLALTEHFSSHKLQNIELWCISFSCEECMRGSKRFVKRHLDELKNSITINLDMVGNGTLSIISAEPYYITKHSMELAKEFQESTKHANLEMPIKTLKFGGTDAAFFSKKKLKAISIMALTPQDLPSTWHELKDIPKIIDKQLLENTLKAIIQYLEDLDAKL